MKKRQNIIFLVVLFILNFLALNDISKGKEDNYYLEYSVIIFSALLLISMVLKRRKFKKGRFNDNRK